MSWPRPGSSANRPSAAHRDLTGPAAGGDRAHGTLEIAGPALHRGVVDVTQPRGRAPLIHGTHFLVTFGTPGNGSTSTAGFS